MNCGLHKALQEVVQLCPMCWVPVRPALASWPLLFMSHTAVSAISSVLQLDHRPLKAVPHDVQDLYIREKSPRRVGSGLLWATTGSLTQQCHSCFLIWLYFAFSLLFLSMTWCWIQTMPAPGCTHCIHSPWRDKLDGSSGKVTHQE